MQEYNIFNTELQKGLDSFFFSPKEEWERSAVKYVNGYAEDELRRLVDLDKRKQSGAFFTNSDLANHVLKKLNVEFKNGDTIYDPCVGAANLLISASSIAAADGRKIGLRGTDIHPEFCEAAKLRLSIQNLLLFGGEAVKKLEFSIKVGDALENNLNYHTASHIITNPPFNPMPAPPDIKWSSGKVSAAAVFMDRIISYASVGKVIIAILPEVLRSGTRYDKWRKMVELKCDIKKIHLLGQFDKYADIDVFVIELYKRPAASEAEPSFQWVGISASTASTIADQFVIRVGQVVDNRDPRAGLSRPFLTSKGMKGWEKISKWPSRRLHCGTPVECPFVVIKRTSRMGDSNRAIATVIDIDEPVFVDNHLIVLKPKSGKLSTCIKLVEKLRSKRVDNWINDRIRCRHLTVKVVSQIPL